MPGPASTSFVVAMALASLVSVLGTLTLWTRAPHRTALRWLARLGLVLLCQSTAVLLAFAVANHAGGYFLTWSEVAAGTGFTGAPGGPTSDGAAARLLPTGGAPGPHPVPAGYVLDAYGLAHAHLVGPTSRVSGDLYVRTPPGYDPHRRGGYPVILVLNGYPGRPTDPFTKLNLAALGSMRTTPSILVSATTNVDGQNWGCADTRNGPQVATWLTRDVPALVSRSFAVRGGARWAVLGISEGAMCAVRLTLTAPAQFAVAISLSGNNAPDAPALSSNPSDRRANDLRTLAAKGVTPGVDLFLAASQEDGTSAADAWALRHAAGRGVGVDLHLVPHGGHNWQVWNQMVAAAVDWLSRKWPAQAGS